MQQQSIKARMTTPAQIELSNSTRSYQFLLGSAAGSAEASGNGKPQPDADVPTAELQKYEELIRLLREETERQREALEQREALVDQLLAELRKLREAQSAPAGD
jgi:hypothetical protein